MDDFPTYKIKGNEYLDMKSSAKIVGISYHSLSYLMRGIEFASSNKFEYKRVGKKMLIRKSDLGAIKKAFS